MNMKLWRISSFLLLACLQLAAQTPTATVVGFIQDPSGAGVPGAAIRIRNVGTNSVRQATSDEKGEFTVVDLVPGVYEVAVEKQGFSSLVETGLELQVNQTARLILGLQVGS